MAVVLGANQYGKAEIRLVRVTRRDDRHELADLQVSVALAGDMADTHATGDNAKVLPTDSQKNTVYAFARDGIGQIEEFGLRLARHFVESQPSVHRARVDLRQYDWERIGDAPHSFARSGREVRTAAVTYDGEQAWVISGLSDLLVLNTTDSEFWGYIRDRYTTLEETKDRILATAVDARWRHVTAGRAAGTDWHESYVESRRHLVRAFAGTYSRSLQQTLYAMGRRVLDHRPEIAEVRLSLPNKHHFLVDLTSFGLDNPGEVFYAADRPYGLIEGTVTRDEVPPAPLAWDLAEGGL
jgi:urate oxidase